MPALWIILYSLFVILLLLAQALALGALLFDQRARLRGAALLQESRRCREGMLAEADLAALPAPVARWLRTSGVLGKPMPASLRLRQSGRFRLGADKPWMPLRALQYYSLDPPQFLWFVRMRLGGLPLIGGGDFYTGGEGQVSMRLYEIFHLADSQGEKLNQGELLRYLSEIIWFPAAALTPAISWQARDDSSAAATIRHGETTASAVFHFSPDGLPSCITAERYMGLGPEATLEQWETPLWDFREFQPGAAYGTLTLPAAGAALWRLADGELRYVELEILEIEYDPAGV